jgi:predicted negative regulator of RcsB-dependent stress response
MKITTKLTILGLILATAAVVGWLNYRKRGADPFEEGWE